MLTIRELKDSLPQLGKIEMIQIRPVKREEMVAVNDVLIDVNTGLQGDHYSKSGGKRMITLIQKEHLDMIRSWCGVQDIEKETRRNIIVSGINLLALHGRKFKIGDEVILEVTGHCHPCSRMETNLGPGGYNAMRGHGGITAKVIQGGRIKVSDQVQLVS